MVAQADNPYHLNGNASQENCNCYTLTPNLTNQSGSVWNVNKINLQESFDFHFDINLGSNDQSGADGIAFVLQPISTSIGSTGGGMGYEGISPSIGVAVDTWQNYEDNDPSSDHITIHKNGIIDHSSATDVAGPVDALATGPNIEDGQWHVLRIIWDAANKTLSAQMDGQQRLKATIDLVADVFGNDPMVFWGFTSATGGSTNHQRMCTSLNPGFTLPQGQLTCFPTPISFIDSSSSFGAISAWYWDFGNGVTSNEQNPAPMGYARPGNYDVKLAILGSNGCVSDTFTRTVVVGSDPVSKFGYAPMQVCEGIPVNFVDSSAVAFGTIDTWNWMIGPQTFTAQSPPPQIIDGTMAASLQVKTREGCVSQVSAASLTAEPVPEVDFNAGDICLYQPALLTGSNRKPAVPVKQWLWNFGDGDSRMSLAPRQDHRYASGGAYPITLQAIAANGCPSTVITRKINVYATNAFAGNDTIAAEGQPITLYGSGGELYKWSPSAGLSADDVPNPIATLYRDAEFVLTASTSAGCATSDTVRIKVYKGPAFYVPSAFTPNGDGLNDRFQFVAVGMQRIDLFHIYNRFGQLVYSSTDVRGGWDGRLNGVLQAAGTYVWMISGEDFNGKKQFKKGTVTLIR